MQAGRDRTYTAYIEYDSDTGSYVGTVPCLPGAHSQGKSLDELQKNLREVVHLVLEERKARGESIGVDSFVGIHRVNVDA
jgi:predicted RNase H-like HicB family nuclease